MMDGHKKYDVGIVTISGDILNAVIELDDEPKSAEKWLQKSREKYGGFVIDHPNGHVELINFNSVLRVLMEKIDE